MNPAQSAKEGRRRCSQDPLPPAWRRCREPHECQPAHPPHGLFSSAQLLLDTWFPQLRTDTPRWPFLDTWHWPWLPGREAGWLVGPAGGGLPEGNPFPCSLCPPLSATLWSTSWQGTREGTLFG